MSVPFNDLSRRAAVHGNEFREAAERVIRSGQYILGTEVKTFEAAFERSTGVAHCVGVNSGTDALAIGLRALGVAEGDEVITVPNTAVPTVAAIRMAGGIPVFCDIDGTHTMNAADLEKRITRKTKVILPVHLYGFPADMSAICAVAKAHGLKVFEDAAQAHGATIAGKQVGTFGDAAAFSFYPTKNLGALGDGGAIVAGDPEIAHRAARIRVYGEAAHYESVEEGVNSRLDEMQAAFLSVALGHLEEWNARRRTIAARYLSEMKNPLVTLPAGSADGRESVWHLFVVQVDDRARFMSYLQEKGIGCAIHYPIPVYRQKAYAFLNVDPHEYPVTEHVVPRIVSLPIFPELTDAEADEVIAAVNAYAA
jgi:dTDP-4-amino-4,6-dideoxygalactose transaminase